MTQVTKRGRMCTFSSRRPTRVAQRLQNPWVLPGRPQQEMLGHDFGLRSGISQHAGRVGMQCQAFFTRKKVIRCFANDAVRKQYRVSPLQEIGSDQLFGQYDPAIDFQAGESRYIANGRVITDDRSGFRRG